MMASQHLFTPPTRDGVLRLTGLAPGKYAFRVEKPGSARRPNRDLGVCQTPSVGTIGARQERRFAISLFLPLSKK